MGVNGRQEQTNGLISPPKIPERKKNSSRQSLNRVSIVENEKCEKKEKKSSFIKEWQKDLKEFFSLRKKKPSTASCKTSVQEERSVDDGKISVDNESLYLQSNQEVDEGEVVQVPQPEEKEITVEENESPSSPENPVEKRSKKRKNRRKTNSETFETNPFKASEAKKDDQDVEKIDGKVETENDDEKNVSHKPKVVVPSPRGIPRPLPINKNRVNRDSFINDEDDVIRESYNVSKSKSIEDTEEFRKAVESFDQMFVGDASGCQTPDVKRISMMESRKSSETPASPNLNWKRIKTGKSFEVEETSQHQESFSSSCNVETREESMATQSFQSEQTKLEEHSHVVQEQFESYSEHRQDSHCQEQSISTTVTTRQESSSSSSSEKKKSKKEKKNGKKSRDRERVLENSEDVQTA